MLISPSDSRIRMASRNVGRDTPKRRIISDSAGNESPSLSVPRTIRLRKSCETISAALGMRILELEAEVVAVSFRAICVLKTAVCSIDQIGSQEVKVGDGRFSAKWDSSAGMACAEIVSGVQPSPR
jgi:hypothetical protein